MNRLLNLTDEEVKALNAKYPYEIFAVTLLMCAPSDLSRAWTNNPTLLSIA
jgi:hypothetical protein